MKPSVIADLILQKQSDDSSKKRIIVVTHVLPYKCSLSGVNYEDLPTVSPESSGRFSRTSSDFRTSPTLGLCVDIKENFPGSWTFSKRSDHSALYSGILSLENSNETVILGSIDEVYDEQGCCLSISHFSDSSKEILAEQLKSEFKCISLFLEPKTSFGHYEGFCKTNLWPLFHYILWSPTDGRKEKKQWKAYVEVNQHFADQIVKEYRSGDLIWIHDYHLLLVPQMVRQKLPDAQIGFFLHTPFPSSEIFRCLPQKKELLEGVLGANLIGFQTYSYARHFISCCTRVLGVESTPKGIDYHGSQVCIEIFPIGVDVNQIEENRKHLSIEPRIKAIKELYAGKKIIIGRDKLDRIRGVEHKLCAFEKFMENYPEWQGKAVLIQVTSPADAPARLETKVSELVSRINGQYGSLGFAPVHHYHRKIDLEEYYALLTVADVALITAVRDGMNTTSHDFVVCQQGKYGPLILSEFTGTAGSLSAAILVNPWDYSGVATSIHEALTMSKEDKKIKHAQLFDYITMNTANFWAKSFVKQLELSSKLTTKSNPTPKLDLKSLKEKFSKARRRLLFLDYDGTLTPIRKTPNAALPPPHMLKALKALTKDPSTLIYVVSGRDQAALDEWLGGVDNLGMSAEHGCFVKHAGTNEWLNLSEEIDLCWKNDVLPIFEYYTERTPGSFVEEKRSSLTWHYRLAEPEYGSWQAKECHNHLENAVLSKLPVEILVGKKNLEVRPQAINKGEIVKRLTSMAGDVDIVLCAGDDKTDEDMFKALRELNLPGCDIITCTIGSATKKTQASWHVETSEDMVQVLIELASVTNKK